MPPMILEPSPLRSPKALNTIYDELSDWSPNPQLSFDSEALSENEEALLSTKRSNEDTISVGSSLSTSGGGSDDGDKLDMSEEAPISSSNIQKLQSPTFGKSKTNRSVQLSQLAMPKSKYYGYIPPLPPRNEKTVVLELLEHMDNKNQDFIEFELSQFVAYLPDNVHHPFEMKGLQFLATRVRHSSFLFDGILTAGNECRYVQGVPFNICSIGNYGEDIHTVESQIWIQSDLNSKGNIYYRLAKASQEYQRFHEGFLWIANLGKHFVDYCETQERVSVYNFQSDFSKWVVSKHWKSEEFQKWYNMLGSDDFRKAVSINIAFLFKESVGVNEGLRSHLIWSELLDMNSVPKQDVVEEQTIVTPFIYECFKHMRFGHHLKVVPASQESESQQVLQENALDLTSNHDFISRSPDFPSVSLHRKEKIAEVVGHNDKSPSKSMHKSQLNAIKVGDVLSVTKDGEDSVWKDEVSQWKAVDDCWYVYVQGVHTGPTGKRSFDALWLYRPSDTSCAKMKYLFPNELFLSDNCTCGKTRITEAEVLGIVPVKWHCHPSKSKNQFFIRQTYLENEKFVTLRESHKVCEHLQAKSTRTSFRRQFPIGQTVLAPPRNKTKHVLEVYEVIKYIWEDRSEFFMLRHLQRRVDIDGNGRPNELVYTNRIEKHLAYRVHSKCLVRFYSESEVRSKKVPAPYCRDGTGNAFYITSKFMDEDQSIKAFDNDFPTSLILGFDPSKLLSRGPLRGMDLYCGGGNFGRGLEEGGAVKNEWAADLNQHAIHVYAANLKSTDKIATKLWYGSVNDLLSQALRGNPKKSRLIPQPGDVDFISAGSPCQGFSTLNDNRNDERGLKNQSMVASVAAYIDFYRPKYGLLENVMAMARRGCGRDEDVLSQLICAIVGMGYQLQVFVVDAWSCRGPQSRTRLFVSFSAPGMEPLEHPALSHSHPPHITTRGLGKLANGQPFGRRLHGPTAFEFVSAGEATKDLPRIGDGITHHCTAQPDHIIARPVTQSLRRQIEAIPTHPRGMNFCKTYQGGNGSMTAEQRALFPFSNKNGALPEHVREGRAWGRVDPRKLFSAICQSIVPSDSRNGPTIHWNEQRILTLMEGRRIQGFPDDEILPGPPTEGWKRLGNSVSRQVSLALGISLREAWLKNEVKENANHLSRYGRSGRSGTLLEDSIASSSSSSIKNIMMHDEPKKGKPQPWALKMAHQVIDLPLVSRRKKANNDARSVLQRTGSENQETFARRTPLSEIPDSEESSGDEDLCGGELNTNEGLKGASKRRYSVRSENQSFSPEQKKTKIFNFSRGARTQTRVVQRERKLSRPPEMNVSSTPQIATTKPAGVQMDGSGAEFIDSEIDSGLEILSISQTPPQARNRKSISPIKGRSHSSSSRPQPNLKSKTRCTHKDPLMINLTSSKEAEDEDEDEPMKVTSGDPNVSDPSPTNTQTPSNIISIPDPGPRSTGNVDRRPHELGPIRPSPAPYQPSDNSAFTAYERTYLFFGHGKNRKHGPKSTW